MSKATCGATLHDFAKFDDATIFCRKCGEQRVMDVQALIAKLPQPVYYPCPYPHIYPATPYWYWYGTTTTGGSLETHTTLSGNTYTLTEGGNS